MKEIVFLIAVLLTGCATKNYGRQGQLTEFERRTLTCREIELETARVNGFLALVAKESEFDARSVLSFLGDFGVGNLMERSSAIDSASSRLVQLQEARSTSGCAGTAVAAGISPAAGGAVANGMHGSSAAAIAQLVPRQGKDAYQAERAARDVGCGSRSSAALSASGAGFETYTVTCTGGDVMVLRCEFGNCRVLK